jgi:hypothetical protein
MRRRLQNLVLCVGIAMAAADGGCSCNESSGLCPASFSVGEACKPVGLTCPWPESKCGRTECTCENGPGGFYWTCPGSGWCSCTCPCGYTGKVSCDSLACDAKPEEPCPAELADVCQLVCADGGRPDARLDARRDRPTVDAPVDATRDAPRPDAPAIDAAHDAPRESAPADRAMESKPPKSDRASDQAGDRKTDRGRE